MIKASIAAIKSLNSRLSKIKQDEKTYKLLVDKLMIGVYKKIDTQCDVGLNYCYINYKDLYSIGGVVTNCDVMELIVSRLKKQGFESFYDEGRINIYWK